MDKPEQEPSEPKAPADEEPANEPVPAEPEPSEPEDEAVDPSLAALEDRPEEGGGAVVVSDDEELPGPAAAQATAEPRLPTPSPTGRVSEWAVGVRLADGQVLDFDPRELDLRGGDMVVVDNDRDLNLGRVVYRTRNPAGRFLRRVVRVVSSQDLLLLRNLKREEEAFDLAAQRIAERNLPMKLVKVVYLHGGNKAVFYFTADGRVDFRILVRDLAQLLHVRIEMRQIGVRDEARLLTGYGICGQPLCCSRYLKRFVPVSIKMAKNQGLALNPQKVSGVCGRLMCCLVYEDALYKEMRQGFPRVGKLATTPRGQGKVLEADVLGGRVRVQLDDGIETFSIEEIRTGQLVPRTEAPRGRSTCQSVISRVRERLLEQRKLGGDLLEAPPEEPIEGEPVAPPAEPQPAPAPMPAAAKPAEGERPERGEPGEGGERRGRRRRRRRPGGQPSGAGQAPASPRPQGQDRPPPAQQQGQPQGQPQAGGEERRRPRRRRRRRPGGGAGPAPNPNPGGGSPAP